MVIKISPSHEVVLEVMAQERHSSNWNYSVEAKLRSMDYPIHFTPCRLLSGGETFRCFDMNGDPTVIWHPAGECPRGENNASA